MSHPPNIPATPQTDERNFPRWEQDAPIGKSGAPYPCMITREFLPEDRDVWQEQHRQFDEAKNKYYWSERCPRARVTRTNGTVVAGDPYPVRATQEIVDEGFANAVGDYIYAKDPDAERAICKILGLKTREQIKEHEKAQSYTVLIGSTAHSVELERLKKENDELAAELTRNADLKAAKVKAESPPVEAKSSRSEKMKAAWVKRKARSLEQIASMGKDD